MGNLIKKSKILEHFSCGYGYYRQYRTLHELYCNEKIELIDVYHTNWFGINNSEELKNFDKNWRTYESCIDFDIYVKDNNFEIVIYCYKGDFYDGTRKELKWKAKFKANISYLILFEQIIEYKWSLFLENKFTEEEELRKKNRISEIEKQLLS